MSKIASSHFGGSLWDVSEYIVKQVRGLLLFLVNDLGINLSHRYVRVPEQLAHRINVSPLCQYERCKCVTCNMECHMLIDAAVLILHDVFPAKPGHVTCTKPGKAGEEEHAFQLLFLARSADKAVKLVNDKLLPNLALQLELQVSWYLRGRVDIDDVILYSIVEHCDKMVEVVALRVGRQTFLALTSSSICSI